MGVSGARLWIVETLVRRGRLAEARQRLAETDPVREAQNRDLDLEAWTDLIAAEGSWPDASAVVADARAWAATTGLHVLPAFADRLEGQAAVAGGNVQVGIELLQRARATFERSAAAWELARTDLLLAESSSRRAGRARRAKRHARRQRPCHGSTRRWRRYMPPTC